MTACRTSSPLRGAQAQRDQAAHRGGPRRGRPQGERRVPRGTRGAGQERGAHPRAQAPARALGHRVPQSADDEVAAGQGRHRATARLGRGDDVPARFSRGGCARLDRRLLTHVAPGTEVNGKRVGDSSTSTMVNGKKVPFEILGVPPTGRDAVLSRRWFDAGGGRTGGSHGCVRVRQQAVAVLGPRVST